MVSGYMVVQKILAHCRRLCYTDLDDKSFHKQAILFIGNLGRLRRSSAVPLFRDFLFKSCILIDDDSRVFCCGTIVLDCVPAIAVRFFEKGSIRIRIIGSRQLMRPIPAERRNMGQSDNALRTYMRKPERVRSVLEYHLGERLPEDWAIEAEEEFYTLRNKDGRLSFRQRDGIKPQGLAGSGNVLSSR